MKLANIYKIKNSTYYGHSSVVCSWIYNYFTYMIFKKTLAIFV